ncbi:MAG: hypothetical protein LRY51_05630, partial [Geovibrio sp.]|nr:hypothetical protein [Geovibrio sp.]
IVGLFHTPESSLRNWGLRYIGPVNGHKVADLDKAFQNAMLQDGPVIIHVSTKKRAGVRARRERSVQISRCFIV